MQNVMCILVVACTLGLANGNVRSQDTLLPLSGGAVPHNLDELWSRYDPRLDPLDVEVEHEWESDGIILRVIRYRAGIFKGRKSMIAAVYGYPKGGSKLPALVQLHGGGQHASVDPVLSDAHAGYASISINWGGNPLNLGKEPYTGSNTDWGAVDGTHPPQHNTVNHYISVEPDSFTLDPVASPRNSNWFLVIMAARRAITFLEQQPQVDATRIGVYGHSMGGKLTTDTAGIDSRVKAAVPSCGGGGDVHTAGGKNAEWLGRTISDQAYIPRVTCPILYLGPTNDFNCWIDVMYESFEKLGTKDVRYGVTPHMNHRHTTEFEITQRLFFDEYLKGGTPLPKTPEIELNLKTPDHVPVVTVRPDAKRPVKRIDVYYSTDADALTRFWQDAKAERISDEWRAQCPILSCEQPLFVVANVFYELPEPYRKNEKPATFAITSKFLSANSSMLKHEGIVASAAPSLMIDDGSRGWHDWYTLNWEHPPLWQAITRKVKDPRWRGNEGDRLAIDIKSNAADTLVFTFYSNEWGVSPGKPTATYTMERPLKATTDWQTVEVRLDELMPQTVKDQAAGPLKSWQYLTELGIGASGTAIRNGATVKLGFQPWKGPREFRNLRWIGTGARAGAREASRKVSPADFDKGFNDAIKTSLETERQGK